MTGRIVIGTDRAHALVARELYRFYRAGDEETLALRGVSLTVTAGEVVAVAGPSGSGKSTLLACLAGLDEPQGGAVWLGGERISHRPEVVRAQVRARGVGVLLQGGNLVQHLSVGENIRLARSAMPRTATAPPDDDRRPPGGLVERLLDEVGLPGRAGALPRQLSGGEKARAGIAVALANDPPVLLADEPTGELDGDAEDRVLRHLRRRALAGTAVVLVTHSPHVLAFADRVVRLHDGRVVDDGRVDGDGRVVDDAHAPLGAAS